jgi:hypothetical protein
MHLSLDLSVVPGLSTFLSLHLPCFTEGLFRRDVRALEDVARVQAYIRRLLALIARCVHPVSFSPFGTSIRSFLTP